VVSKRRITIRDVAAEAGVSITTVSDSLSGRGRLNPDTRARVAAAAARLGYSPSSAAKNVKQGRTGVLLMSITAADMDDATSWNVEFFVRVMSGASEYAFSRGYALAMVPLNATRAAEKVPCDGFLLIDPTLDSILVRNAADRNLPIVTIGRLGSRTNYVDNDIPQLVAQTLDLFEQNGARRPALISSPLGTSYTADTMGAYLAWCAQRSIEPLVEIISGGLAEELARAAAIRMTTNASRPDAILGTLESVAKGALAGVLSLGLGVPTDCLIASLSDSGSIAGGEIPITALDLNPSVMGAEAAKMLINLVEGSDEITVPRLVPGSLIERASTLFLRS